MIALEPDTAGQDADTDIPGLIVILRAAALLLEQANTAYDYDVNTGKWSPASLRYEADYLERHAR